MLTETVGESTPLVFALPGNEDFARRLALAMNGQVGELEIRDFPDGETYVRVAWSRRISRTCARTRAFIRARR